MKQFCQLIKLHNVGNTRLLKNPCLVCTNSGGAQMQVFTYCDTPSPRARCCTISNSGEDNFSKRIKGLPTGREHGPGDFGFEFGISDCFQLVFTWHGTSEQWSLAASECLYPLTPNP